MGDYDKDRVARVFDEIADVTSGEDYQTTGGGNSIPEMCGAIAYDELRLAASDVLLDVGTGKGGRALAAAGQCRHVIGIDISLKCLDVARSEAKRRNIENVTFAYGAFEELSAELDLLDYGINKILTVYSFHHLPDAMKKESIAAMVGLLRRPGRIVIGDIITFDDPDKYSSEFDRVNYDDGDMDFPATSEFLIGCFEDCGGTVTVREIHPLVGVIAADLL